MLPVLPLYCIRITILVAIRCVIASHVSATDQDPFLDGNSQCPVPTSPSTPLTLWDVGFSLHNDWVAQYKPSKVSDHETTPAKMEAQPAVEDRDTMTVVQSGIPAPSRPDDSDLVSFEEWKRMRLAEEEEEGFVEEGVDLTAENEQSTTVKSDSSDEKQRPRDDNTIEGNTSNAVAEEGSNANSTSVGPRKLDEDLPVPPMHHRYNYASPDCSARITSASSQTQHSSSLLHKSRDRYMLTPCKADEHWVVVELCDEIRIEAIELAIWEFFSGIVREVRLSVGGEEDQEDDSDSKGSKQWKEIGTFVGNNVRGVQTFTLPQATSFHRFLRLDFLSFYGSEYYCPVSQLRVFGMNQMEAFKWEQKRLASGQKGRDKEKERIREIAIEEKRSRDIEEQHSRETVQKRELEAKERELNELERLVMLEARRVVIDPGLPDQETVEQGHVDSSKISTSSASANSTDASTIEVDLTTLKSEDQVSHPGESNASLAASPSTKSATTRSDSSESIYVVITRRLNALEGNSSLIARYIEEQSRLIRSALSGLEKDWDSWRVSREVEDSRTWEQERMRQEDRLGRLISQIEQQRLMADHDRRIIASQMRVLTDELSYERRRGLAQMGILIILLILGLASRSSVIDAVLKPLVVEAKRRRSIYNNDQRYGPLAGLRIDRGLDRPLAVIGKGSPIIEEFQSNLHPISPTPTPRSRPSSKVNILARRPGTPSHVRQRRQAALLSPAFRSFSANDPAAFTFGAPRIRGVAGMASELPARKMARNTHLHLIDTDKPRERQQIPLTIETDNTSRDTDFESDVENLDDCLSDNSAPPTSQRVDDE